MYFLLRLTRFHCRTLVPGYVHRSSQINASIEKKTNVSGSLKPAEERNEDEKIDVVPKRTDDLIRQSMKGGDFVKARAIFDRLKVKSSYTYQAMLQGLVDNGRSSEAFELFQKMPIPTNEYLLSVLFKMCASLTDSESLKQGKKVFEGMSIHDRKNSFVLTSALNMFMQRGDLSKAEEIFSQMEKNVVTYNTMMSGYLKNQQAEKVLNLFPNISQPSPISITLLFNACAQLRNETALKMGKEVFQNLPSQCYQQDAQRKVLGSALDMFVKCDDIDSAESLFARMKRDTIAYGLLMKMYNDRDEVEKTFALFERMKKEQIHPNNRIFVLLTNACARLGDKSMCQSISRALPRDLLTDLWIANASIDMWGKAGAPEQAERIFGKLRTPDAVSFTAMINAYGLNGMGNEAVNLFHRTPETMRDSWVYVSVLNGCSHSGLIDEAWKIFKGIPVKEKSNLIYTTMVDTLARGCHLEEAENLVHEFEKTHAPYLPMYMAMLSAARNQRNVPLAQKIFDRIRSLFSDDEKSRISATILLCNTYALSGDVSRASDLRIEMDQSSLRKTPGLSMTVIDGQIHKFHAHDRSHPEWKEIHRELDHLREQLLQHGHRFNSSWISRPMRDDESVESLLCGHSEKLAMAFNFYRQPNASRVQITQNLRICGDCHEATKLIAKIRQCLIIVRDANRIHHFHPTGQCSCQDHF